jgi:hypothetical protein
VFGTTFVAEPDVAISLPGDDVDELAGDGFNPPSLDGAGVTVCSVCFAFNSHINVWPFNDIIPVKSDSEAIP